MGFQDEHETSRQWKRYKVDLRVRVIFTRNGTRQSAFARGHDVSEGGMSVFTAIDLDLGTHVEVEFAPPRSRRPLLISAVIRNREGYRYGFEFVTLSPTQREDIVRLCETMMLTHPA